MRKIPLVKWKENNGSGKAIDTDLTTALTVLIANKDPREIPKGLEQFRLYGRLSKAFERAQAKGDTLILEEAEYQFVKSMLEKDVPATWGMNSAIAGAVEAFLNAKEE